MRRLSALLIGILLLSACSPAPAGERSAGSRELQHGIAPASLTASLRFRILEERGPVRTVGIVVLNPEALPIQSVRAWVRFDPALLTLQNLSMADDRFALFAPGERTIAHEEGFLKVGVATREPVRSREFLLATFAARVRPPGERPSLSFYDWRPEGDGHTAMLSLGAGGVRNVLQEPSSLSL